MKKTLLFGALATIAFTANAQAFDVSPYVSAKATYGKYTMKTTDKWTKGENPGMAKEKYHDEIWGLNAAFGLSTKVKGGDVRAEFEYVRNGRFEQTLEAPGNAGVALATLKTQSYMLNAYYDFDAGLGFTPYIGGGIGYTHLKASMAGLLSEDKTKFTWQLGAGVAYALCDHLSVDLGYRYTDMGKIKIAYKDGATYSVEPTSHEVLLGLRYTF